MADSKHEHGKKFLMSDKPSGFSTIKWTTLDPWRSLSESDSKQFTNFEFCEKKNHKHFKNTLIYKAKNFMLTKKISKKFYIFQKMVQVSVQAMILNKLLLHFKNMIKLHCIDDFLQKQILMMTSSMMYNEFKEYEKTIKVQNS